ncbi:ComF family protein [Cohnella nanjingensis]|uniref:ComF family protein n=1 Tax=Cohnella nanjingensis TaxID=1387779 RepID=A0A7X0RQ78_9BACL|nr:ComF family protein [Cohnella nanjingensis]MBB6671526.1 ComF family protein [Cohnella nanjingensis]
MMRWMDRIHRLLQPQTVACLRCEREIRGTTSPVAIPIRHSGPREVLSRLCSDCRGQIPWILAVGCPICGRPERCGDCLRRRDRHIDRCRSAVRYDGAMKEWLAQYKYAGAERLEPVMAAMLAASVERMTAEQPIRFDLITSVPLAAERLEERGFNQAERMAIRLSHWYGIPYRPLLRRVRHTEKMSGKSRQSRLADLRGMFAAEPEAQWIAAPQDQPIRLLLVDDIYTTGSTVNECACTLRSANPRFEVSGALWARS